MEMEQGYVTSVLGTGSYLPERVVTNEEIGARVPGASAEWIADRTAIVERRYAAPDEAASDLAVHAARAALDQAGLDADGIDLIIVATTTGDAPIPSTASLVQLALGAHRAACFDVNIACTGFVTALSIARAYVALDPTTKVLVIGTDVWTRFIDFDNRATSVLFGDGAGAAVIGSVPHAPGDPERGLLKVELVSRADAHELISMPAGGSRRPASVETVADGGHLLSMQGRGCATSSWTTSPASSPGCSSAPATNRPTCSTSCRTRPMAGWWRNWPRSVVWSRQTSICRCVTAATSVPRRCRSHLTRPTVPACYGTAIWCSWWASARVWRPVPPCCAGP